VACFHPLFAVQTVAGDILFHVKGTVGKSKYSKATDIRRELTLPCGQCIGCRLERSRQWAMRCMHEAQCHDYSVFVTLTYDDDHNSNPSLNYRHFQLFMKRLRKRKGPVRFYMCGEYGDLNGRRHFHACLFGCFFTDREFYRELPSGHKLYTSSELADLWQMGFCSIGDVTFESAAYVARYVCKKVNGKDAEAHYERVDDLTGEIFSLVPEFSRMSLKPGIGAEWFKQYRAEVFGIGGNLDRVVVNGNQVKPPKYYDNLLKSADDFDSDMVEFLRSEKAKRFLKDNSPERLVVREVCAKARLKFKLRSL